MIVSDAAARIETAKVVVLGPAGAGVRSVVAALRVGRSVDVDPTRPVLPTSAAILDERTPDRVVRRLIVHAAPSATALALTKRRVLIGASGLLVVLDGQHVRFAAQRAWLEALPALLRDASVDLEQCPAVLFFNKADLPETLRAGHAVCDAALNPSGRPSASGSALRGEGLASAVALLRRAMRQVVAVGVAVAVAVASQAAPVAAQPTSVGPPVGMRVWTSGRLVVFAGPAEARLATSLLADASARGGFPGIPALRDTAWVWIAPDERTFRRWVGPSAPEWGAAIAFPARRVIVLQGRDAGADAGDPVRTFRHELAHLALAEVLGPDVPRWFDEGYASFAAGEWGRDEVLATSVGLIWRGIPSLAGLDSAFDGGSDRAQRGYALAHRAVVELAVLGGASGLSPLFTEWRASGSFDAALRAAHGLTAEGFEARFRTVVRRQYGVLALAADLGVLGIALVALVAPFWWRRRRESRARLDRMRAFEARQEAADRASALAELLGDRAPDRPSVPRGASVPDRVGRRRFD